MAWCTQRTWISSSDPPGKTRQHLLLKIAFSHQTSDDAFATFNVLGIGTGKCEFFISRGGYDDIILKNFLESKN